MRIAYITPYQGPTLVKRRPVVRNRSMADGIKIELIARLLHAASHDVEVLSHGEVIENRLHFYPAFGEPERFHSGIPVHYISALPIRRLNGVWSSMRMLHMLKKRHRLSPFDLLIIFNLKRPQIACAKYATRHLRLPVILEYEDDAFVSVAGESAATGFLAAYHRAEYRTALNMVSGGIAASPHLLSQLRPDRPKLLLRGVVGDDMLTSAREAKSPRLNRVLFSGSHVESNGVTQLIAAWDLLELGDWELHITGSGHMTNVLREMAQRSKGIVFHGLVSRGELVRLMCSARICINPHAVSQTPGNVFAFKMIEYLGAGAHVVTTPMGPLEPEIEAGVTYMKDNAPETIAATLRHVIAQRRFEQTARQAVEQRYGAGAVAEALGGLVAQVVESGDLRRQRGARLRASS